MPTRRLISLLSVMVLSILPLAAQKLPSLGTAGEISKGTLPDGVAYYLVKNAAVKGYADMALVQKGRQDSLGTREALVSLPHFHNEVRPYRFLARKGVGYSRNGYIQRVPAATIFRFNDVPVYDNAASDSTLLILFDLIDTYSSEQAVIISGDIDQTKILERMKTLSMMVSTREKSGKAPEYVWVPRTEPEVTVSSGNTPGVSRLVITYSAPRPSKEQMNTLQPLVTSMFAKELETVLTRRVKRAFREADVPLGSFRYRYSDSAASSNDETYTLDFIVGEKDLSKAVSIVSAILAELDRGGVSAQEFKEARDRIVSVSRKEAGHSLQSNRSYVSRCEAAFLYGANLAPLSTINDFFSKRRLPEDQELAFFNNFVSALLDSDRNLSLHLETPDGDICAAGLAGEFRSAWQSAMEKDAPGSRYAACGDTLNLPQAPKKKVKVKSAIAEPLTGGELWTFANGVKVIYKKVSTPGEFSYALLLKGGTPYVPHIADGQSAFVGDMLKMCDISGMSPEDFISMLESNGISMESKVSLTNLSIRGSAPKNRLQLLLRSLLAVANERGLETSGLDYYKRSEALRLRMARMTQQGLNAVMDSVMTPDFRYPDYKNLECLTDDLPEKVYRYAYDQFSKVNDGIFIFMGDLDAEVLKQTLGKYLGDFRTESKYNVRPQVNYHLHSGWSTYTVEAGRSTVGDGEVCVNVAMATGAPFSMNGYMAFRLALIALEKSVIVSMAEMGMYVDVKGEVSIFPTEKMRVFVNCRQCRPDGLPADIKPLSSLDALRALRTSVSRVASSPVTKADLEAWKAALTVRMQSEAADFDNLMDAALVRYSEGKDMISGYAAAIKSVSAKEVQDMLSALDNGSKVEYVIR